MAILHTRKVLKEQTKAAKNGRMEEKKEEPVQYKKADKKLEQKLQEQSNNFWNKLSNEEKKALSEYSDVHYGITNRYLRNALYDDDDIELDNTKERIRHLDKV